MAIIGTLKEIKIQENRVGLTPEGVRKLVSDGHKVLVQKRAGLGAGYTDIDYKKAGAKLLSSSRSICKKVDLLIKVKEPLEKEYKLLKHLRDNMIFTYLHLAAAPKRLTKLLLKYNVTSVAYETVEDKKGGLPLLAPMSKVAGVLAVQYGAQFLQKKYGGLGTTLSRISGTATPTVVIVGAGTVGSQSAQTALGLGAKVILSDINKKVLSMRKRELTKALGKLVRQLTVRLSTQKALASVLPKADLLIGAVLVKGARAPVVVTKELVRLMHDGAVIIDVAIDQGGCVHGSRPTTHDHPVYEHHGKVYCNITNMPGQVPHQSTQALTAVTLPYIQKLAKHKLKALRADKEFGKGVMTHEGVLSNKGVSQALKIACTPFQ